MTCNDVWKGEDIFVRYNKVVLMIAEGTGDNLDPKEDVGFVDYFYLETYNEDDFDFDRLGCINSIGGGIMLREKLISEEFYGRTVKEVVDWVFEENAGDAYDLYTCSIPDYEVLSELA